MFANMDYPHDDEDFRRSVELEARQQLANTRIPVSHCCAGNSRARAAWLRCGSAARVLGFASVPRDAACNRCEICPRAPLLAFERSDGGAFPHMMRRRNDFITASELLRPLEGCAPRRAALATGVLRSQMFRSPPRLRRCPGALPYAATTRFGQRAPRDADGCGTLTTFVIIIWRPLRSTT